MRGRSWCSVAALLAVACAFETRTGAPIEGAGTAFDGPPEREDGGSGGPDESSSSGGELEGSSSEGDGSSSTGEPGAIVPSPEETPRVRVVAGEIDEAELVETLPVGRSENGAKRRIVLELRPDELPDLRAGDRLQAAAEVQVTTRCDVGQSAAGCGYDPTIAAQLILTGDANDRDAGGPESRALSDVQTQTCTKGEHHCMFVFRPDDATTTIANANLLPCVASGGCRVHLVMWAWDPQARSDGRDKVIVGSNEGDYLDNGIVEPDRARLMAIRERGIAASDRHEREASGNGGKAVPSNAAPVVVYSLRLKDGDVREGEQFVVEAKIVASVGGRARFSTELVMAKDPNATDGGLDAIAPKQIGEHNGINCLPSGPCTTRKVAVFRVADDVDEAVYVNVVVRSAVPGGGSTNVTVHRDDGWLRAIRYNASQAG